MSMLFNRYTNSFFGAATLAVSAEWFINAMIQWHQGHIGNTPEVVHDQVSNIPTWFQLDRNVYGGYALLAGAFGLAALYATWLYTNCCAAEAQRAKQIKHAGSAGRSLLDREGDDTHNREVRFNITSEADQQIGTAIANAEDEAQLTDILDQLAQHADASQFNNLQGDEGHIAKLAEKLVAIINDDDRVSALINEKFGADDRFGLQAALTAARHAYRTVALDQ